MDNEVDFIRTITYIVIKYKKLLLFKIGDKNSY